jgi:hypothetical protein
MRVPAVTVVTLTVVTLVGVLAACTGDGDPAAVGDLPTSTLVSDVVPTEPAVSDATTTDATTTGVPSAAVTALPESTIEPPITTFAVVEVPETGVPGLDSDDSFCAAWSRFGGSWQVIQVAANFAPDPSVVPAMEVVAAPVVAAAYDAVLAAWPDELADERDVVADGFFGPLDRRAEAALDSLTAAGATSADLAVLGSAWEAALAARQPDDPVVTPVLTDALGALVEVAAAGFAAQRVDFVDDPSMRITADTPRTDAYLATACPDQGALTGGEVDGG